MPETMVSVRAKKNQAGSIAAPSLFSLPLLLGSTTAILDHYQSPWIDYTGCCKTPKEPVAVTNGVWIEGVVFDDNTN
jgi:hypothetical protein